MIVLSFSDRFLYKTGGFGRPLGKRISLTPTNNNEMIKLTFTPSDIRRLIQANPNDRLAEMLLDALITREQTITSLLVPHLRKIHGKLVPVETNKIFWIKELREWSRNNPERLALFEPRHPSSGDSTVLGLAEAKEWIEKSANAAAINALL